MGNDCPEVYRQQNLRHALQEPFSERRVEPPVYDVPTFYAHYIACLNGREWQRLGEFVADDAIHNGRRLGMDGYRAMLEGNCRDIPDLHFDVEFVMAAEDHIASRIRFDCTPVGEFLGVPVNGRRVLFREHAFYTLRNGRIAEVFSVVDKAAIEAQLGI